MQAWIDSHPEWMWVIFPVYFVTLWVLVGFLAGYIGGWRSLASRFRARGPFNGLVIARQSGQMRWIAGYGNCLNLGANHEGLFLSTMILFRAGHPSLLIPWDQITVSTDWFFLMGKVVKFRLGREPSVPLWIRAKLADKLKESAGSKWPVEEFG